MSRILFVHLLNDYSGSPMVLKQVIKVVQNDGREMMLLSGNRHNGFLSEFDQNHYIYKYKRFNNRYLTLFSFLLSQINLFFLILKLQREFSVIYINTMLPFGAALAGKLLKRPVIYHIHETTLNPLLLKLFLRKIVSKTASKIFFVSDFLRRKESFTNIPQYTLYNALPAEFIQEAAHFSSQKTDNGISFNVLMIASLKQYKGVEQFVEISRLCEPHSHIKFILVLNATQGEIDGFFSKIILPANVEIFSRQENVHPFYQKADLVLNLTIPEYCEETFGLTILEAFAYSLPVIGPPVGGPAEIIRDGIDGYLISSLDVQRIANKILSLSLDSDQYHLHSINAYERWQYFNNINFNNKFLTFLYD